MMMKKDTRVYPAIIAIALFMFFAASCSEPAAGESTSSPTKNLEESVQLTLTHAVPSAPSEAAPTEAVQETAEVDACELPLPSEKDWPVVLCETFDDNTNGWQIESQDNPYANYNIDIKNGRYELDYSAKGFAGFQRSALTWFDVSSADNFAMSVTTLMNSDFQNVSWGVAFRADEDSFFLFSIYNDNTYAFEIYEDNGWIPLISQRVFEGIRPNEENKLTIVAEGGNFTFSINDEPVNTFSGGLLQEDGIMLVVTAKEGATADFYFDDVVLQAGS